MRYARMQLARARNDLPADFHSIESFDAAEMCFKLTSLTTPHGTSWPRPGQLSRLDVLENDPIGVLVKKLHCRAPLPGVADVRYHDLSRQQSMAAHLRKKLCR
ncbi:hypothetical protein PsYK624_082710 [Phanerochaete sordida]|uniref:Uncharacterized protein n=1 Tax=Phanerochaete sordida TaxID=48140 RepID=A0A9P3G9Z3_9APHY|nr:hypothetical protein PsYK624_082710 [Phanerochaete sordida]